LPLLVDNASVSLVFPDDDESCHVEDPLRRRKTFHYIYGNHRY
jgi:hypothetical protein